MKKPVSYWQTDPRWSKKDYSAPGESTTIGASGCGPTSMAMVLATWADPSVTPETECAWALRHGFKAPHSGTYYGYFEPAGARYGLKVRQLNWTNLYGKPSASTHADARAALDRGGLVIACMGPGTWTRSGHYVLVWKIDGGTVYINDPASQKPERTRGNYNTFRQQVKYYWTIEAPEPEKKEDPEMDAKDFLEKLTPQDCLKIVLEAQDALGSAPVPEWCRDIWEKSKSAGFVDGARPECWATRAETAAMISRAIGGDDDGQ